MRDQDRITNTDVVTFRIRNSVKFVIRRSYHDDFLIPGISPRFASSRKQMRQRSKSRKYPRLRPQRKQRRTIREENFGRFRERAMTDFLAIGSGTDGKAEIGRASCR